MLIQTSCPLCYTLVEIDHIPSIGEGLACAACGGALEVLWLYPLELGWQEFVEPAFSEAGKQDENQKTAQSHGQGKNA